MFDRDHIELFGFLFSVPSAVKPGSSGPRWAPIKLLSVKRTTKITVFPSQTKYHKAEPPLSGIGQEHVIGVCIMILYLPFCKLKQNTLTPGEI